MTSYTSLMFIAGGSIAGLSVWIALEGSPELGGTLIFFAVWILAEGLRSWLSG